MISKIRVSQASEIIPSAWGLTVQLGFHVKFFPTGKHLLSTVDSSLEGFRFIVDPELARMFLSTTRH